MGFCEPACQRRPRTDISAGGGGDPSLHPSHAPAGNHRVAIRQPHQNHRFTAGVSPMPGVVVNNDVDMADTRCNLQRFRAKYWLNTQVLRAILNKYRTFA